MKVRHVPRITIVAVFVALATALVARQVFRMQLTKQGLDATFTRDLSYLIVPLVLALVLFPLWRSEKNFLALQFRSAALSWHVVWSAIAIGVLIRGAWWSYLIARISFGFLQPTDPALIAGPLFGFECPTPIVLAVGFFVTALLTPVIEEVIHRAYVLTALLHRGAIVSVLLSAFIFAIFHNIAAWPFAFFAGVVLGAQYWITRSLWPAVIAHATVNGLILLDWRCFSGHWNPRGDVFPILTPGIVASVCLIGCLSGIYYVLKQMAIGARNAPIAVR